MTHKLQHQPFVTIQDKPSYEQLEKEVAELRAAFNLAYDHLCDLHFLVSQAKVTTQFVKDTIKEVETTAKTNRLFIEKKKEEGGEG